MTKLKLLELFGGIGACSKALDRLGISYEIVDYVEIDKYACVSYNAIHNTNFEPQDITTWDKDVDVDLIMHGSPCQDFSLAGKQAGGDEGSGTRSSLMYETIRIVKKLRPKYVVWENVKNLLSKKHKHNFDAYLKTMEDLGYINYYQVLNAKDYGIPQNRERVFTISIYDDIDYDTDFEFPKPQQLKLKLKDMLDDEVDKKYYLSDAQINRIKNSTFMQEQKRIQEKDYCDTSCARDWKDSKCIQVCDLSGGKWDRIYESCRRVYSPDGISPTIPTCQGGNTEPKVAVNRLYGIFDDEKSKHQAGSVYDKNGLAPTLDTMQGGWRQPCVETDFVTQKYDEFIRKNGYVPQLYNPYNNSEINDIAPTQTTSCNSTTSSSTCLVNSGMYIRKLTPKECWRLMGFDDSDFEKAEKINSNTQLYKQAGNSIVVNVLEEILKNLLF